jgi:hypothetical protein
VLDAGKEFAYYTQEEIWRTRRRKEWRKFGVQMQEGALTMPNGRGRNAQRNNMVMALGSRAVASAQTDRIVYVAA